MANREDNTKQVRGFFCNLQVNDAGIRSIATMAGIKSIKAEFPLFAQHPNLVYLDSAATSQKPQTVIDAMNGFYAAGNANIHRGLYELSAQATQQYETVRHRAGELIGASNPKTIAFTKGATEAINAVAFGFLQKKLKPGDNVVITTMEHHANIIPWQQVCQRQGASLAVLPIDACGDLRLDSLPDLLRADTRLLAVTHISNTLGTINPVEEIIDYAHKKNIPVLVDAAQSVGHYPLRLVEAKADFIVFSAHKMFGPQGVGVLYCREEHWDDMTPYNFGGGAIEQVTFSDTTFLDYPHRMEAGTPHVAGVVGLGAAIDFIGQLDMENTSRHVQHLAALFREGLNKIDIRPMGSPKLYGGIVSFQVDNIHPHDVAGFLAQCQVAVRAGHHCTQPLHEFLGVPASVRASFSIYNTPSDVDSALQAIKDLRQFWL